MRSNQILRLKPAFRWHLTLVLIPYRQLAQRGLLRPNEMWTNQSNGSRLAYVVLCSWACHAPFPRLSACFALFGVMAVLKWAA